MDNFVVSARKYRPATFVSVIGQGHITSTLKNAILRNQLAHAYLFCGPRGVGKTTCARIFAKAINCLSPIDNEACGECESCKSFNEGRSFNIHELDAASNNSVDDIRSLTEQVRIPPQIGRYSVYIIDEAHMLSAQAFNAFLKTLEEPPAHAVFILATTEKHKIIPTILSRCQIFDFNRIRVEDSVEYLKYIAGQESVTFDDESLHLIALKADGGMRDALSMFDKAVSFCGNNLQFKEIARTLNVLDYDTYFNVASLILQGDYPAVLTTFDEVLRNGFSPQNFIGGLNGHLRDLLMSKNQQTLSLLEVSGNLLVRYEKQGAECPAGFLFEAIAALTALDGTLRTATSQRLNVELSLMKLCGLGQKKNSDITAGIEREVSSTTKAELPPLTNGGGESGIKENIPPAQACQASADVRGKPSKYEQAQSVSGTEKAVENPRQPTTSPEIATKEYPETIAVQEYPETEAPTLGAPARVQETVNSPSPAITPVAILAPTITGLPASAVNEVDPSPKASSPTAKGVQNRSARTSILGNSIGAILNQSKSVHKINVAATGEKTEGQTIIDPDCEKKIAENKTQFLNEIHRQRPRIAMALEEMEVSGNRIMLYVPTETLYEEIMRNRAEILSVLTEVGCIEGGIEFVVSVREDDKARKPIKVEDKLRFLTEKNPALTLMRKELNLEID